MEGGNIQSLITGVGNIVTDLIPIVAGIALLAFFWGLVKYIFNAGGDDAKQEGKRVMTAGIISLFLIAAIGGIISFISNTLGVNEGTDITPPTIRYNGGGDTG